MALIFFKLHEMVALVSEVIYVQLQCHVVTELLLLLNDAVPRTNVSRPFGFVFF